MRSFNLFAIQNRLNKSNERGKPSANLTQHVFSVHIRLFVVNNLNIILCLRRLSVIQISVVSGAWKESNWTLKFSEDVFGIEVAS